MSDNLDKLVRAEEGKVVTANGLRYVPLEDKPYHMSINPEAVTESELHRSSTSSQDRLRPITGQTRLDRYPALFGAAVRCVQSARPKQQKRILSAPSSIGAEAVSIAARLHHNGQLNEYHVDCVDISADYIRQAQTMQFPGAMLIRRSGWLQSAFEVSSNPLNDQTVWIEPVQEIKDAITVHEPQNMGGFKASEKYDIVFMMTIFTHLTASQQTQILENMLTQCSGLLCFDVDAPRIDDTSPLKSLGFSKTLNRSEGLSDTLARVREQIRGHGFLLANPFAPSIEPYDGDVAISGADFSNATIAIHPDLASDLS